MISENWNLENLSCCNLGNNRVKGHIGHGALEKSLSFTCKVYSARFSVPHCQWVFWTNLGKTCGISVGSVKDIVVSVGLVNF